MADAHRWLTYLEPAGSIKLNSFFFPYAGAGTQFFRPWQAQLPRHVGCYLVHLPGHERRIDEPFFDRMEPLVQALSTAILPCLDLPFVFFGHSMGALLSFELARELRRKGCPLPRRLFISACAAPQIKDWHAPSSTLSEASFLQRIDEQTLPAAIRADQNLLQTFLPVIRGDFALCETYRYSAQPPLDCPISVCGGIEDACVSYEDIVAWGQQTTAPCLIRMFPGGHLFVHSAQDLLVQAISQDLVRLVDDL
jgi:medium-chain acyl-[acyl-carrier-protein] hydrolase